MPNLLFLCDTYPPRHGGSERMLCDMARAAVAAGHTVLVLTPGYSPESRNSTRSSPSEEKEFALGMDAECRFDRDEPYLVLRSRLWGRLFRLGGHRVSLISRLARVAIIFYLFWRVLRIPQIEGIVVGHALPLGSIAAAIKRLRGISYLMVTYGEEISVYARSPRMRNMLGAALRDSSLVVCLTRDSAEEIAGITPEVRERTEILAPKATLPPPGTAGLDLSALFPGLSARRILLSVSRLVPRKGIDTALQAFARVASEFPDLAYVIVGQGPDLPRLEIMARELGIEERVRFASAVASTAEFYHACDIFVMPNRTMPDGEREGYGIVFLEAGLAGKPSIGGRSGGAIDAIEDGRTGYLVDPEDPEAVAQSIRKLLRDPVTARRMGQAGQERSRRLASPEAFGGCVEEILRRAFSGKQESADPERNRSSAT